MTNYFFKPKTKKQEEYKLNLQCWQTVLYYQKIGKIKPYSIWKNNAQELWTYGLSQQARMINGGRAKSVGVIKGILDYTTVGEKGVVWLEAKVDTYNKEGKLVKGVLSKEQKEFTAYLESMGQNWNTFKTVLEFENILREIKILK
jgi:hypothetical protein